MNKNRLNRFYKIKKIATKLLERSFSEVKQILDRKDQLSEERYIESELTASDAQKLMYIKNTLGQARCAYCDKIIHQSGAYAIDRIDNAQGYTLGNIVFACPQCNAIKGNLNLYNLLDFSQDVVQNLSYTMPAQGVDKVKQKAEKLKEELQNVTDTRRPAPIWRLTRFKTQILDTLIDVYTPFKEQYSKLIREEFNGPDETDSAYLEWEEVDEDKAIKFTAKLKGDFFAALRNNLPQLSGNDLSFDNLIDKNIFKEPYNSKDDSIVKDAIQILKLKTKSEESVKQTKEKYSQNKNNIIPIFNASEYKKTIDAIKSDQLNPDELEKAKKSLPALKREFVKILTDTIDISFSDLKGEIRKDFSTGKIILPTDLRSIFFKKEAVEKQLRKDSLIRLFKIANSV